MSTQTDTAAPVAPSSFRLLLHGIVAFMVIAQVGMSGVFMYYALNQTLDRRIIFTPLSLIFWLIIILLMVAVDAFLIRWLFRMADGISELVEPEAH